MRWNKENPRFSRSMLIGERGRLKKSRGFLNGKLNGLWRALTGREKPSRPEREKPQRPKPPLPVDLFEDLKIAVPKSRQFTHSRPARPAMPTEACQALGGPLHQSTAAEESPNLKPQKFLAEIPSAAAAPDRQAARPPRKENGSRRRPASDPRPRPGAKKPLSREALRSGGQSPSSYNPLKPSQKLRRPARQPAEGRPPRPHPCGQEVAAWPRRKTPSPIPARDPNPTEVFSPFEEKTQAAPAENPTPSQAAPRSLKPWSAVFIVLLLVIAGVAAYLAWPQKSGPPRAKVTRIPAASLPKVAPLPPGFFELYAQEREAAVQTEVTIQPNGSLGQALEALGLGSRQRVSSLISYLTKDEILKVVQPGDVLRVFWRDQGKTELARLEYQPNPNLSRADLLPLVIMGKPDGGYWHYSPISPLLTLSAAKEGVIDSSLWLAGGKVGLDGGIITSITEILASDIDFMTNIRKGDTFQVLYSREYRDGQPKGEPVIDMVKLRNRGQDYEYYRFVAGNDQVGYYDAQGRSSRKAFFATPLQYKRISSQFTMTRLHPIHKVVRPHQGVDYAAPNGTPVSAVADGTVIFCGWNGGYGRLVTIKHDETYTTMYAHLSKFVPGLKKGSMVKQGDLIGNVGATGTATGPHLDFRLKKNGNFIDPVPELAKQQGKRLESGEAQAFAQVVGRIQERMTQYLTTTNTGR